MRGQSKLSRRDVLRSAGRMAALGVLAALSAALLRGRTCDAPAACRSCTLVALCGKEPPSDNEPNKL